MVLILIMDDLEKFNETTLPGKEKNYSKLNIEDSTDAVYIYTYMQSL